MQWRIQDFPEEGAPNPEGERLPIIWPILPRQLHENEEISGQRGGGSEVRALPHRFATEMCWRIHIFSQGKIVADWHLDKKART